MIKKLICIIVFLGIVLSAGFFESHYITSSFNELEERLTLIRHELSITPDQIDTEENITNLKNLHKDWQNHTKVLKFFVWHTGIKDVEVGLSRITSYTEENDYTEAYTELNNLIDYSNHYSEDYKFSFQNII